ncbi:sigma factor-like helix-turn-helix DNA-binding protein [Actinoplanes sp. NPDC023936]|uniref:sigma factor-like helix-turn-helix DNA-binding protein n=1 Tax=Actinoplanes sp. NPDC023936 TaxID=3154910 RepID=UPI003402DB4D
MSRRNPVTSYSPTEAAAIAPEALEAIVTAIETLSERPAAVLRMRFGLNGPVKSHAEIAAFYNTTTSRIRDIEIAALSALRHPSRAAYMYGIDTDDLARLPQILRNRILQAVGQQSAPVWCEEHGYTQPSNLLPTKTCSQCSCLMTVAETGRPRQYCSATCRKRAQRERERRQRELGQ